MITSMENSLNKSSIDKSYQVVKAIAPGKIILFGEHFVVYGFPSLIASIEKFFNVTIQLFPNSNRKIRIESNLGFTSVKHGAEIMLTPSSLRSKFDDIVSKLYKVIDHLNSYQSVTTNTLPPGPHNMKDLIIQLNSELPLGGGLGSSSAFCVALSGSLYYAYHRTLNKNEICFQAINAEKLINRNTSGADCNTCLFGGLGVFEKKSGFRRISANLDDLEFLIIDTGEAHDTYSMIERVSKFRKNNKELFGELCNSYMQIYQKGLRSIEKNDLHRLGSLLNQNHELLLTMSISNTIIDKIVEVCNAHGALGTKITGAGGGGCILSLIDRKEQSSEKKLLERLETLGVKHFFAKVDKFGLRLV